MPGGIVCYIERSEGGTSIQRVRLVGAGLIRTWSPPESRAVSSVDSASGSGGAAVATARAAAAWIADTLEAVGLSRLAAICLDADGAVCAWLSAHSPDTASIHATVAQSAQETDGSGAGVGAARLLTMSAPGGSPLGLTGDTSVQALATLEPQPETAPAPRFRFKRAGSVAAGRKHRYAVVAVPDAPARVILDELDARAIETDSVLSLWHAMAAAWDTPAPSSSNPGRVIDAESASGAVVLVEPSGRLVWAWTSEGELVAGGTIRLASLVRRPEAAPGQSAADAPPPPLTGPSALVPVHPPDSPDAARRISPEPERAEDDTYLEFSDADAGRIAVDWLAWSAQLGHCPQRVVCLACPTLSTADSAGPATLARALARLWPGATIDGAVHEDPVGATLARVAGIGPDTGATPRIARPAPADDAPQPRAALVGLTARPGRADRRLHQWIAAAFAAGAVLLGAAAWRLYQSAGAADLAATAAAEERRERLRSLETIIPNLTKSPTPRQMLEDKLRALRDQVKVLKPSRPVIQETVRLLDALKSAADTKLNDFEINVVSAKATLSVPDAETGPNVLIALKAAPGILPWQGSTPSFSSDKSRQYILTAIWPVEVNRPASPAPQTKP